jgi:hypothetical protein
VKQSVKKDVEQLPSAPFVFPAAPFVFANPYRPSAAHSAHMDVQAALLAMAKS